MLLKADPQIHFLIKTKSTATHQPIRAALTCHALALFGHTEALQLLLLVEELFDAHTSCPEDTREEL